MKKESFGRRLFSLVLPMAVQNLFSALASASDALMLGFVDQPSLSAVSLAGQVSFVMSLFHMAFIIGATVLAAQYWGKGDTDAVEQARRDGGRLCRIAVIAGAVSGGVLLCLSPLIMGFAGNLTDTARGYLQFMLAVCSYYMIGKSVNSTVIAGIFCAGGNTRFGLRCDAITMWCIIVPIGLLAAFVLGQPVPVVYFLQNLDEFVKLPAVWRHYHRYGWVKNLTNETQEESING